MAISGLNAQNYSTLFSSLGGSNSSSGSSSMLSDYMLIKNGTYRKMLNTYYGKDAATTSSASSANKNKVSSTELTEEEKQAKAIQESSGSLKALAEKLNSKEFWEKSDAETIKTTMESFVKSYNEAIDDAAKSNDMRVLRSAAWMTTGVAKNSKLLSEVGITIGNDNKLSLNTEKLAKASQSTLKTLFTGSYSVGGQISQKAGSMYNAAGNITGTYTSAGKYNESIASILSGKLDLEV